MDSHWRNSMKVPRFWFLDARSILPFLLLLVMFRLGTLIIALLATATFWMFERYGLTFDAALRAVRSWMLGPKRPGVTRTLKRRMVDYG